MENLSSRSIEVTVISAEGLRLRGRSIKKNAFVVVRSPGSNACKSTSPDTSRSGYPSWNQKLDLPLPSSARFMCVEVQCRSGSGRAEVVCGANVPVSDFSGGWTPDSYLNFLSYRLRDCDGERNGIINLSIKVINNNNLVGDRQQFQMLGAYDQAGYCRRSSCSSGGNIAVGVPVSWRN